MIEDIAGSVDEALVGGHEEDGPQVAGEAEGEDEGEEGPVPQAEEGRGRQHHCTMIKILKKPAPHCKSGGSKIETCFMKIVFKV